MTNETTPAPIPAPVYLVTRIGSGAKLHLSQDYNSGRLYPSCGNDSPWSKARRTTYTFSQITCLKCQKKAKLLGLV